MPKSTWSADDVSRGRHSLGTDPGIAAICRKVQDAAREDLEEQEKAILAALAELHQELDAGRIPDEEFDAGERDLLDRLEACHRHEERSCNPETAGLQETDATVLELLDRVLNTGVVLVGDVVITVADIELIYLRLQLMLSSAETAREAGWLAAGSRRAG